jgi:hypothetical protein
MVGAIKPLFVLGYIGKGMNLPGPVEDRMQRRAIVLILCGCALGRTRIFSMPSFAFPARHAELQCSASIHRTPMRAESVPSGAEALPMVEPQDACTSPSSTRSGSQRELRARGYEPQTAKSGLRRTINTGCGESGAVAPSTVIGPIRRLAELSPIRGTGHKPLTPRRSQARAADSAAASRPRRSLRAPAMVDATDWSARRRHNS